MLSEYSTETLDKILCLFFINICEDLICNSLAWKTATSKVSSVYTVQASASSCDRTKIHLLHRLRVQT